MMSTVIRYVVAGGKGVSVLEIMRPLRVASVVLFLTASGRRKHSHRCNCNQTTASPSREKSGSRQQQWEKADHLSHSC